MARKTWVFLKRSLATTPLHRQQMGEAIWLFIYILDNADWDTGTIENWHDDQAAEDMDAPLSSIRRWRRSLQKALYISMHKGQHNQKMFIHNWRNPRSYASVKLNIIQAESGYRDQLSENGESDHQSAFESVAESDHVSEEPTLDQNRSNKDQNNTSANAGSNAPAQPKARLLTPLQEAQQSLEQKFSTLAHIPLPLRSTVKERAGSSERWWNPLARLWNLCEQNTNATWQLIEAAYTKMIGDDLTISSIASVEKVAISIRGRNKGKVKGGINAPIENTGRSDGSTGSDRQSRVTASFEAIERRGKERLERAKALPELSAVDRA